MKHKHSIVFLVAGLLAVPGGTQGALPFCTDGILGAWCIEADPAGSCDDALHGTQTPAASNDCDECRDPKGRAVWWVSEPYLNVRLSDEPLTYRPAVGPAVSFKLSYRQRGAAYVPANIWPQVCGVGRGWSSSLISYLAYNPAWTCEAAAFSGGITNASGNVIPGLDCGFLRGTGLGMGTQNRWEAAAARDGSILSPAPGGPGYEIRYADGSVDIYTNVFYVSGYSHGGCEFYFLSERHDPHGLALRFEYDTDELGVKLRRVIDAMGDSTWLEYTNTVFSNQVTAVLAPFGRRADLYYNEYGDLVRVSDAAGIETSFGYGVNALSLTTPYGMTYFDSGEQYTGSGGFWDRTNGVSRYVRVTQPDQGKHLYLYRQDCSSLANGLWGSPPGTYGLPETLDTGDLTQRISAYWGPRQYAALSQDFYSSSEDPDYLTAADYAIGRLRHWLGEKVTGHCSATVSCERSPAGLVTWYDYAGKTNGTDRVGASSLPRLEARRVAAESSVRYAERNAFGAITNFFESYTRLNGTLGLRTNTFYYAVNQIDLLGHVGPDGTRVSTNTWGTAPDGSGHYLLTTRNALEETLQITYYYPSGRPNTVSFPSGLVRTFDYDLYSGRLSSFWDTPINRTNRFTWYTNGTVETHTDERGLTVTCFWDGLDRLTGTAYPDDTTTTNLYAVGGAQLLHRTATKDRLGHWTQYAYDSMERLSYLTNANERVTAMAYCDCGSLTAVTNALGTAVEEVIAHDYYPISGELWHTYLPDGTTITRTNDLLGRVTSVTVGDVTRNFLYNHQGLATYSYNALGTEQARVYDLLDRPVYMTDASGVSVTNAFDPRHRLLTRTWPDGGVERFGYSARGLTAYTNQLDEVTSFGYDEARRRIAVTNANNEILRYTNNAAGDLLSLTDGKNQTTRWNYDAYGRVTNKLDQADVEILRYAYDPKHRLTNRWSKAKGNTAYSYDPVGNLTNINYPSSPDVSFAYDPLNRLTTMVDAVGTTEFTYAPGGQLLTEDGPFASDTLTNLYQNRLRAGLSLQQPAGTWTNGFRYDAAWRLTNVTSRAGAFDYTYSYASPLPLKVSLPNTAYIANTYDSLARLIGTWLKNSSHTALNSHEYEYNAGHQRTYQVINNSDEAMYDYDRIGQLTEADTTYGWWTYAYDAAWNLTNRSGQTFTVDGKNQLSVTLGTTFTHDHNGNLISEQNGVVTYAWDDENQLTQIVTLLPTPGFGGEQRASPDPAPGAALRTDLVYDGLGRLRVRDEYFSQNEEGEWVWYFDTRTHYVYDGRRVIQERDANNTPLVSYTRGNDLSGSLEGAGGIGGLLGRSHVYVGGNWYAHNYYHADGGGNVTYLMTSGQGLGASYRYDPYGNVISSGGGYAEANVYRYSSKEHHAASGLYYYGYRWYEPQLQRWLNRDPIGEAGGINLYQFVFNAPANYIDPLGLEFTHYYSQGGILQPSGSTPYLAGENFGENVVASIYNTVPVAANALERFFDPLARVAESLAEGARNAVTQITGAPEAGEGARNLLLAASMISTKRCPPRGLKMQRYGSAAEAEASEVANKLLPRPGHERQPKWIGLEGTIDPRTLGKPDNYTHRMDIYTRQDVVDWLNQNAITKPNEPGRWGVTAEKLDEFNKMIEKINSSKR